MKKNKEWLKEEINKEIKNIDYPLRYSTNEYNTRMSMIEVFKRKVDQLDEPELPAIPQFVADWIEESKGVDDDFWEAATEMIRDSITSLTKKGRKVHDWLFGNSVIVTVMLERQKLITRAWLYGYTIEKEPDKLYEVKLPTENAMGNTMNLVQGGSKNRVWFDSLDDRIVKFKFTEQEIKAIDERYWAFATEVK